MLQAVQGNPSEIFVMGIRLLSASDACFRRVEMASEDGKMGTSSCDVADPRLTQPRGLQHEAIMSDFTEDEVAILAWIAEGNPNSAEQSGWHQIGDDGEARQETIPGIGD